MLPGWETLMKCPDCKKSNESDALFCTECGRPLGALQPGAVAKQRRAYFIVLLFVPAIVLAAAVGYYKFFLPNGIAAIVNGEEITLAELDSAVARMEGTRERVSPGLRYQVLNELIAERLALQEARKAGIHISKQELDAAAVAARVASGLDVEAFQQSMISLYGGMPGFEKALERRLTVSRLITERVIPPGSDSTTASRVVHQWLQDLSGKAAVRIALSEELAGPGCGCCNDRAGNPRAGEKPGQGCAAGAGRLQDSARTRVAVTAAIRYWREKHGPEAVGARPTDFGCHIQVDIVKDGKIIGSLRYQNGTVFER